MDEFEAIAALAVNVAPIGPDAALAAPRHHGPGRAVRPVAAEFVARWLRVGNQIEKQPLALPRQQFGNLPAIEPGHCLIRMRAPPLRVLSSVPRGAARLGITRDRPATRVKPEKRNA